MEGTFSGVMTLHALIRVVYNDPDISTYSGFEIRLPGNGDNSILIFSEFPPSDYLTARKIVFDQGYYPLLDKSVTKFVEDGGIISYDVDFDGDFEDGSYTG